MLVGATGSKPKLSGDRDRSAKPYCKCWNKRAPSSWNQLSPCSCGEDAQVTEWEWEEPAASVSSWVLITDDHKQVNFHPFYSSGTAAVKGNTPLLHNYHYYWEVKMLTETYGTDIMVGLGTNKVNIADSQFMFTSLLGQDGESYGLSYTGVVRHNATAAKDNSGFCRGSIIGVRVDMWLGTLEFYINRKPQGISFYNLRRHEALFPIVCSTAAQSSLRLVYAASWRASLAVDAARALGAARPHDPARPKEAAHRRLPPGLALALRSLFWFIEPPQDDTFDVDMENPSRATSEPVNPTATLLSEVLPSPYVNGFYVDNVERNYRLVVWE